MRTTLILFVSIAMVSACKSKDDAGASGKPTDKADKADKPAGALKTTPADLFADFTKPNADGMALLDKYHDGATFTAKVKTAPGDAAPTSAIFDVDGSNKMIMAEFADAAKPKIKSLKAGDSVTVTCKIGGANGNMMQVSDCVPQ